ncbi:MAG: cache domain-containing protein, partial [Bdellovibrionota bacterium]
MYQFSLKKKLIFAFVGAGLVPMALINFVSYTKAKKELQEASLSKVEALSEIKEQEIKGYFDMQENLVKGFAVNPNVREGLHRMSKSFYTIESEAKGEAPRVASSLESYYTGDFAKAYKEKSDGGSVDPSSLFGQLDNPARWAQFSFISQNPSALGSKHEMVSSPIKTTYAHDHEELHPFFKSELERYGFYDIFLVTPDAGRVVYTVFKELDFGTSLTRGAYANTGLGRAFQAAKKLKEGKVWFEDYALYTPSYEAPASFLSAPVYEHGELIGVFIVQIPLEHVSGVVSKRAGLGKGGESYVVGTDDGMLRTDTFRNKDSYSVMNSFRHPEKFSLKTEALNKSRTGAQGVELSHTYDGTSVVGAYNVVEVLGRKWTLFVEIPEDEAFAGLLNLNHLLLGIVSVATLLIGL